MSKIEIKYYGKSRQCYVCRETRHLVKICLKLKLPNTCNIGGVHNAHTIGHVGRMQNENINYSKANDSWNHMEVGQEMEWNSSSEVFKPHVEKKSTENIWNREGCNFAD